MGGGGKGGTNVTYEQSPEQAYVYQALSPMIGRLAQQYGGIPTMPTPTSSTVSPGVSTLTTTGLKNIGNVWGLPKSIMEKVKTGFPIAPTIASELATQTAATTPTTPAPPIYEIPSAPTIPSPAIASPLAAYGMVAPQVQAGLWHPYEEAERRLMDVLQSRGQLGAPGAGVSGAAAAGLGEFYSQAARDVGLGTYQMALPFTQMAQAPLSQYWAAQTGQLGDVWQAQLQREMMPWQMLPGLLGGAYPTGIAQEQQSIMPGLMTAAGLGLGAYFGAPWVGGAIGSAVGSMF